MMCFVNGETYTLDLILFLGGEEQKLFQLLFLSDSI